jgi:hypothetical protein
MHFSPRPDERPVLVICLVRKAIGRKSNMIRREAGVTGVASAEFQPETLAGAVTTPDAVRQSGAV